MSGFGLWGSSVEVSSMRHSPHTAGMHPQSSHFLEHAHRCAGCRKFRGRGDGRSLLPSMLSGRPAPSAPGRVGQAPVHTVSEQGTRKAAWMVGDPGLVTGSRRGK